MPRSIRVEAEIRDTSTHPEAALVVEGGGVDYGYGVDKVIRVTKVSRDYATGEALKPVELVIDASEVGTLIRMLALFDANSTGAR